MNPISHNQTHTTKPLVFDTQSSIVKNNHKKGV